jgi:NAD(P)-dependent dehydrogenase (short-subunit alcohol dehydrogenase family)
MKLVLADINESGLQVATQELNDLTHCVWMRVDVRELAQLERLEALAFETFGGTDVLFNNAGVVTARPVMQTTVADWRWMLDVNLWSVIHGINAFVPRMLSRAQEGRIVNTASAAGFVSVSTLAAYCVSKHGVVTLSESLHQELAAQGARLGVTIVCPAFTPTNIAQSEQYRPPELTDSRPDTAAILDARANLEKAVRAGRLTAKDVAGAAIEGVRERALYVFPHAKMRRGIEERLAAVFAAFDTGGV